MECLGRFFERFDSLEDIVHMAGYCDTLDELADRLGISLGSLYIRVRRDGITLPRHIIVGQEERVFERLSRRVA